MEIIANELRGYPYLHGQWTRKGIGFYLFESGDTFSNPLPLSTSYGKLVVPNLDCHNQQFWCVDGALLTYAAETTQKWIRTPQMLPRPTYCMHRVSACRAVLVRHYPMVLRSDRFPHKNEPRCGTAHDIGLHRCVYTQAGFLRYVTNPFD